MDKKNINKNKKVEDFEFTKITFLSNTSLIFFKTLLDTIEALC